MLHGRSGVGAGRQALLRALVRLGNPVRARGWDPRRVRLSFGEDIVRDLKSILSPGSIVLDVGANEGQTIERLLDLQNELEIHSFEPNPEACDVLAAKYGDDARIRIRQSAVSSISGPTHLHVTRASVGSSLLEPEADRNEGFLDKVATIEVDSVRIDDYLAAHVGPRPIGLLKSDSQGSDLDVLLSAGEALHPTTVRALLVEANFEGLYEGQASVADLISLAARCGFWPAGIYPKARSSNGAIRWADILFMPAPSPSS